MSSAEPTTMIDDERVRVTRWHVPADGGATGPHVHELDYLVVPVTGGTFQVTNADGSVREMTQEAGVSYAGAAGTDHDVVNTGNSPAVFVEVELKR